MVSMLLHTINLEQTITSLGVAFFCHKQRLVCKYVTKFLISEIATKIESFENVTS